ncbi:LysR family transcriptional regulator [Sedimentimonas flavescens]|uniref:LysR family transcriptional regulator n=1 Tax=Sedimentimonas flavescens TaxID=2851012 RepID=UPI0021A6712B|nr:LysR family transcriptional regulator [Sedimentimonas flavescens]MCT2539664.1 LysR family transcriptional regulator [Sedimentimonas flavescens]WBL33162.1 LysR family transcriptional regulator [Sinirhodobacter sp. HNIBRBA609]
MTKRRTQMNLRGFQVFDAVARHLSVTAAAEELGITQSAASHQLRKLSDLLGEVLIERQGRSISLTDAGRRLADSLDGAFDLIEQSAAATIGVNRRMVRLALYSSFASGWMIPALPQFTEKNPDIDLRLIMISDPPEITDRVADVFVSSEPQRRGYWSTRLFRELLVPVAAPQFRQAFARPIPLISSDTDPVLTGKDWEAFAVLNGLEMSALREGAWRCCSHYLLALEMVRAGMGAALVPDFIAFPLMARGEVVRLPGDPVPTGLTYDIQVKYERRNEPDIARLVTWLRSAARRNRHEYGS